MKRYRRKPEVVEAMQFERGKQKELLEFTEENLRDITIPRHPGGIMTGTLATTEGERIVREYDYIVKKAIAEFYPVKPRKFLEIYEEVGEDD